MRGAAVIEGGRCGGGVRARARGLPRSPHELSQSLLGVATLRRLGWFEQDRPVPWLTYAAVRFLESLNLSSDRALEFGSGASTRWLLTRCAVVRSIEHDPVWFERVRDCGADVRLADPAGDALRGPADSAYLEAGRADGPWDLVVVDGMSRLTCVDVIDDFVTTGGLVIVDDTDVQRLAVARETLEGGGFHGLDFWGFKPGVGLDTCTTVFCRDWTSLLAAKQGA